MLLLALSFLNLIEVCNLASFNKACNLISCKRFSNICIFFHSADENKASIVLLSTSANVISCHTSMVGVNKERKEKVTGDLIRQNVPVMYNSSMMMQYQYCPAPRMNCASMAMVRFKANKNVSN